MSSLLVSVVLGTMTYGAATTIDIFPARPFAQQVSYEVPAAFPEREARLLDDADERFLVTAARENRAALAAADLMAKRSDDAGIRDLARRITEERRALQEALEVLAIRKNASLPGRSATLQRRPLASLERLDGPALDRAWLRGYTDATQHMTLQFQQAARHARDREVKAFASDESARLRHHVEISSRANSGCGCGGAPSATATAR